jgi:3-oxosteroid 1-dehydrogenase
VSTTSRRDPEWDEQADLVVVGSGAAALGAALTASVSGFEVLVLEKSRWLGGTSAMSGAGIWIPGNHLARAAGVDDDPEQALTYLRATAPEGWAESEDPLWQRFAREAPAMLELLDRHTPLELELIAEPDPMAEYPGGKAFGRMLSVKPLRRRVAGPLGRLIRRSTLPHIITYAEAKSKRLNVFSRPLYAGVRLLPRIANRLLTGARGQGTALIAGMLRGCLDSGCTLRAGCEVLELVRDDTGAVTGVVARRDGALRRVAARRGVVLATGGFEWDEALRERHFPGPYDRTGSPDSNRGDGHRMAQAAGAALAHMDQANVFPTLPTRYEGRVHGLPLQFQARPHAIVVNRHAERFANEMDYNFGEFLDARAVDGSPRHLPCWMIADDQFLAASGMFRWYARKQPGWVRRADSIEALAGILDLPPERLAATVARFNELARRGRDEDFRRGESIWDRYGSRATEGNPGPALGTIETPPFIALSMNRSILVTKGGPRTDANGQVLRPDGSAIAGLYCAGVAMANPIGTRSVGAGTTLGPCLTWGYICARSAIASNR